MQAAQSTAELTTRHSHKQLSLEITFSKYQITMTKYLPLQFRITSYVLTPHYSMDFIITFL